MTSTFTSTLQDNTFVQNKGCNYCGGCTSCIRCSHCGRCKNCGKTVEPYPSYQYTFPNTIPSWPVQTVPTVWGSSGTVNLGTASAGLNNLSTFSVNEDGSRDYTAYVMPSATFTGGPTTTTFTIN